MLADEMNGSRLWAFLALPLGCDKAYFMTDFDAVKCITDDAVPMEIDLAPIRCLDDAVIVSCKQLGYTTVGYHFMALNVAAGSSNIVFKLAPRSIEGIADSHIDVLVSVVRSGIASDYDFTARNRQLDANMIELALAVMYMRRFNDYPAARDLIVKLLKPSGPLADARFNGVGMSDAAEGELYWNLHAHAFLVSFVPYYLGQERARKT